MKNGKTILIIDDSNTNLVLLEAILGNKGFSTISAPSVKDARLLINRNKVDLILLDLLMPEISGYDFLEEVNHKNGLHEIPIIVVSALTDDINIEKTKKMGAVEFIKKPININNLLNTVSSTLEEFSA